MSRRITRTDVLSLLLGLLVWAGVVVLWGQQRHAELQEGFDTEARILHRVLSQRAEQHDAILDSLTISVELGLSEGQLGTFVQALTGRYPQISGVQLCTLDCQWLFQKNTTEHSYLLSRTTSTDGRVQLWIDPNQLLRPGEGMSRATFTLQTPERKLLLEVPSKDPVSDLTELQVEKVLGSASQPFVLTVHQAVLFRDFSVGQMVGTGLLILLLAYVAGRGLQTVLTARRLAFEAEQALQSEKERAQVVLSAVDDALITFDRNHTIVYANPAAQTLLNGAGPLIGSVLLEQIKFEEGPSLATLLEHFWQHPAFMELPDGLILQGRHIEGSLSPLPDQSGAVLVLRDLGPFRQRMLHALEESERKLKEHEALLSHVMRINTTGEVASGMAHELNQPLTAILSHSQGALRVLQEGEMDLARTALERTVTQAKRAGEIIQRLRAQLTRQPLVAVRVNLQQLMARLVQLLEADLQSRHIQLNIDLSQAPPVEADPIQLEQVLHNLIRNSMEALQDTPASDRKITLQARTEGSQLLLSVRDHGPGLSDSALEHLFLPFHSTKKDGMGIGLSLSRTLMQSMNGELSGGNHPDGGALFTLTLPVFQEELHVH
ncbi:sensor histidine kinase [Deinococcus cellulosilyticus]|uniref:histidine kinase n=1 Tax=Deinococcus cellulosilyticus (strain DSM 18568 / NBRC 106333 / KACC 11606 / 5516J-15) TaxID=1223518 RepID=A0A511N3L3_DEIC1|nr:ATP-binding protein [Deinococcus cellulosilyticus]GEM47016.1 hypothetical protein DC3_26510 [Deinococcus cellulosilyticus NBRC 106333 = KACC 11606]